MDSCCLLEVVGVAGVDVSVALTQPKGRGQIFMLDLPGFLQVTDNLHFEKQQCHIHSSQWTWVDYLDLLLLSYSQKYSIQ